MHFLRLGADPAAQAVRMTQAAGIAVRAAFMLGNPGETVASMRRTIDFAKEIEPDIVVFNITIPFPGTEQFAWARRNGYLRTRDWRDYDGANAVLELPTVSSDEVNRMYRVAYHEFYFRLGYLLRRLARIRTWEDIKMDLRALRSVVKVHSTGSASRSKPPSGDERARQPLGERLEIGVPA